MMGRKRKDTVSTTQDGGNGLETENTVIYTPEAENAVQSRTEGNNAEPLEWDDIVVGKEVWLKRNGYNEGWYTVSAKGTLTMSLKSFRLTIGLNKANYKDTWAVYRTEVE
jgi:hypothetical protein